MIHREAGIGTHKADSAAAACNGLNREVKVEVHRNGVEPVSLMLRRQRLNNRGMNPLRCYLILTPVSCLLTSLVSCAFVAQANAVALVEAYDCVLDCSDNPATRYLVNDACVRASRSGPSANCFLILPGVQELLMTLMHIDIVVSGKGKVNPVIALHRAGL